MFPEAKRKSVPGFRVLSVITHKGVLKALALCHPIESVTPVLRPRGSGTTRPFPSVLPSCGPLLDEFPSAEKVLNGDRRVLYIDSVFKQDCALFIWDHLGASGKRC